ncbi:MAG: CDP-alcohol phosphatidyltransferase family protein [Spirochaetes bacterium]|nr:CDP-alcohol phosphatidyltransferase family protein [Spirochaetota bacterium]
MKNIRTKKKINVTIGLILIWMFCIFLYFTFINLIKISLFITIIILISETILCLFLWLFFMIKIDWLKDLNTGREITYLNISNVLSSVRFTLVPLLIVMFGLVPRIKELFYFRIGIVIFGILIGLTDLFDGFIARKFNEITNLGKIIDPVGDFLMITAFSILLYYNEILEIWFFILSMIRIPGLFIVSILLISLKIKINLKTTFLGKTTIFYILCLLGIGAIKLLLNLNYHYYDLFLIIIQIIGSILIILSSIEKIKQMIYILRNQDKFKNNSDNILFENNE